MGKNLTGRANFSYTAEDGVVCIVDSGVGKSVTNDAESVIQDLVAAGVDLESHRVIYRDTIGMWDQLLVKDGQFANFKHLNTRDLASAIAKVKESHAIRK